MNAYLIAGIVALVVIILIVVIYVVWFMPLTFAVLPQNSASTPFKTWGFAAKALTATPVDCKGRPLTNMQYQVDGWGTDNAQLRYGYGCADVDPQTATPMLTNYFNAEKSLTTDFAGVKLDCNGAPIGSVKYILEGDRGRFAYDCLGGYLGEVKKFSTPLNESGGGQNIYLNRHNIKCPENQALGSVMFKTGADGKIQYDYTCGNVYA